METDIEDQLEDHQEFFKQLSMEDFLKVGMDQVAYIRRADEEDIKQNADLDPTKDSYIVYAADGSQISIMNSYDTAIAAVRLNDLFPVTVH